MCPGEGNVAFNATPNPFHLNKICLNQRVNSNLTLSLPGNEEILFSMK